MSIKSTAIFQAQNNLREKQRDLVTAEAAVVAAKEAVVHAEKSLKAAEAPGVKFGDSKAPEPHESKSKK